MFLFQIQNAVNQMFKINYINADIFGWFGS